MKPQYITDDHGKRLAVVIPIEKYQKMIEELEDAEDVRLYDEAMAEDDGESILFSDYLNMRKARNE